MTEQKVTLIAVTDDNRKIICVYLNGYRVAGRKPWVADNSVWREIEISKLICKAREYEDIKNDYLKKKGLAE